VTPADGSLALEAPGTPALLLDRDVVGQNLARLASRLRRHGVPLRPHVKTARCIEVIRLSLQGQPGGVTASTLEEVEYCVEHGISDVVYAVGLVPGKVGRLAALSRRGQGGATIRGILDSVEAARAVGEAAAAHGIRLGVLLELDVDGHRSGVTPDSALLPQVADAIAAQPALSLDGVLTHAGESYACRSREALEAMAEQERAGAVRAATRLRDAGHRLDIVSVGSTPTATFARSLEGVTEVRAGVYMFNDLMMAGLGACGLDDIALSVLVAVIGHQPAKGWIITDGGWTALSRDRSTASLPVDQGYGIVRSGSGAPLPDDLVVSMTSQEHGIVVRRAGGPVDPAAYPVGTLLRILPNHACATAAQFTRYHTVGRGGPGPVWDRAPSR